MSFSNVVSAERSIGRRREDRAMRGAHWAAGRERRRPVLQTDAAAQSVVMARFAARSVAPVPDAAQLYLQARPQKTEAELRWEEFMREAELAHQAAQRAWVFERRTGKKPRTTDIEYAEIIEDCSVSRKT